MFDSDSYADLLNLVDDILLQILSLCGIYGVLTVGQVKFYRPQVDNTFTQYRPAGACAPLH